MLFPSGVVHNDRHSGESRNLGGGATVCQEKHQILPPFNSPLDIKEAGIAMPRPLCLSNPACEGGFQTRLYVAPLRFAKADIVIETIHPIISSTIATRLDPHTLQRAFPAQHLTRLDHPSNGPLPFQPLVAVIMSAAVPASRVNLASDVEWRLRDTCSRRFTVCFAQGCFHTSSLRSAA